MFSPKSLVRRTRRVKRIVSCGQLAEDTEPEEVVTPYEDVTQYYPKAGVYRPLILIGELSKLVLPFFFTDCLSIFVPFCLSLTLSSLPSFLPSLLLPPPRSLSLSLTLPLSTPHSLPSLTPSLPPSPPPSLTPSLRHPLPPSLSHSLTLLSLSLLHSFALSYVFREEA